MKMNVRFLQEGGAMEAPAEGQEGAPAGGPEEQLMQMAQAIIEQVGPEGAAMLAEILLQMLQGGGEPSTPPTIAKKGAKMVIKKKCKR